VAVAGEPEGAGEARLLRERGELEAIADEWRALAEARSNAFVTPEWFWSWLRHYPDEAEPAVPAVFGPDGSLRGLLPLVTDRHGRDLRFAGSSLGDHFEPVASQAEEAHVVSAAGALVTADASLPRMIVTENVGLESEWTRRLWAATGFRGQPLADRRAVLPRAGLAGRTWEDYLASRSRNLRSQLGRKRRALERDHELRVRWTESGGDAAGDMATLFRLHDLRWAGHGAGTTLTSERARAFHADFAAVALERGWLRLAFLEIDDSPVAAWYGWRLGDRFAYYQAGFDPAWGDRSVGLVLFGETIRAAVEEGAGEYDMLLGGEDYKQRFADSERVVCTLVMAPRFRPARVVAGLEARMRSTSRRLPDSIRGPAKRGTRALLERLPLARRR
jgi:CelD/BcsL family acetyltransferase involved in cellulose biosynthesis